MSQDFRRQLRDQLELMDLAAAAYDAGKEVAAKQLATAIRVLVHDTKHSKSLLTHLGVKRSLPFCDTAPAEPVGGLIAVGSGLCNLRIGAHGTEYAPPLDELTPDRVHPPACFDDWWERYPVLTDIAGNRFSRRSLVLNVANKDGGAHVDGDLPSEWEALTRFSSLGFSMVPGGQPNTMALAFTVDPAHRISPNASDGAHPLLNSIELASVRQIAHELRTSIDDGLTTGDSLRVREPLCPIPFSEQPSVSGTARCTCGSGRSFKDCFGRRRPRNQREDLS